MTNQEHLESKNPCSECCAWDFEEGCTVPMMDRWQVCPLVIEGFNHRLEQLAEDH